MFIEERDLQITDIVWNYFDAVREKWPKAWAYAGRGLMLNKTNGFRALMRFMRPVYLHLVSPGEVPEKEEFKRVFARIESSDDQFTTDVYLPGTSGESALYRDLLAAASLK